jgi:hypothetical protein
MPHLEFFSNKLCTVIVSLFRPGLINELEIINSRCVATHVDFFSNSIGYGNAYTINYFLFEL